MSHLQAPYDSTRYASSSSSYDMEASSSTARLNPHQYQSAQPPAQSYLNVDDTDDDVFDPQSIDPELRLRTVRTAHSVLAESIKSEALAEKRAKRRRLFRSMRRKVSASTSSSKKASKKKDVLEEDDREDLASEVGGSNSRRGTVTTAHTEGGSDFGSSSTTTSPKKNSLIPGPPSEVSSPAAPPDISLSDKIKGKGKGKGKAKAPPPRRTIYVNIHLPKDLLNGKGDPIIRYVRNKVKTTKYTLITFIPKNLFEQFRRVANIYFLFCVIIQLFSVFGAPNAQIGMLPLLAILGMTAIKDGIEDWRRSKLDDQVNNSATTKLAGSWRNWNQPKDPRNWFEKMLNIGLAPGKTSKGVKKLREREGSAGNQIMMEDSQKALDQDPQEELDVVIVDKESYPLSTMPSTVIPSLNITDATPNLPDSEGFRQSLMLRKTSSVPSMASRRSNGVVDWNRPTSGSAQWERTLWKKLEVGDLVLLRDNEQVPADIIVLSTSNPDNLCFVETKNLDGETNLKIRRPLKATSSIQSEEDLQHARFIIDSEPPHANLYTYNGVLRYTPADPYGKAEEQAEGITINELLLRGCSLRNTKWVIGMVAYTGADTKIMLNGGDTPSKRSKIEKETNFNVVMNFIILFILCLTTALLHGWYRSLTSTSAESYEPGAEASDNIYLDSVIIFFSCLIVFQNIVPISLYITVEIVKTIQAYFIFQDVEMYYEPYDTPCVPKTWNISDDLGQIEYVFSDKTGTLTQNVMEFKKCSIQGVIFGEGMTEAMMGAAKRDGQETGPAMEDQEVELNELKAKMLKMMKHTIRNKYLREDKLTLIAPNLVDHMANPSDPLQHHIIDFFRALAICHSVLSDAPDPAKPYELDYKAESPDEAALVAAARDVGFPFINKNNNSLDIEVPGSPERWTPLKLLEFNSSRKRMSVVARSPDGRIILYCKGADSVIYQRLDPNHDEALKQTTLKDLETFANGGLRTLCIAYRELSETEFAEWSKKYDAAAAATVDREGEIEKACELVEHSLTILGATALEDKLQEGVPNSIAMLHRAGIKLWILTGDKLQTAIEIGYSCNLLTNDMEVMIISADSADGARAQIEAGLNKIASVIGPPPTTPASGKIFNPGMNSSATFAVVIDGESLRYALQPSLKGLFLSLGTQCSAVICCRVSPSQKALTVRLVKEGCNAMTLSIGDGANDVAMIQEANIGIGLYGLEGSQAAMSADYAFGQFRFLTRLLLVHGRWSYVRVANMHANFFYKNAIFTVSMFWFFIFSSFDATYLFEYTFLLMYNLFYTSLPVAVMGAFDQDVNAKAAMAFPQLYKRGIAGIEYTRTRFWLYMADGLYQSAVIFFIPFLAYGAGESWSSSGRDTNCLYDLGTAIAAAGVLAANSYVGINSRYWTVITWVIIILSTLLVYIWIPIYSYLAVLPFSGTVEVIYSTFTFWATIGITWAIAVGPRWFVSAFKQSYLPKDSEIIREAWITGHLKRELGVRRRKDRKESRVEKKQHQRQEQENLGFGVSVPLPQKSKGKSSSTRQTSLIDHFSKMDNTNEGYGYADERGDYQAALTFSPQKDFSRSPNLSISDGPNSGSHTPRSVFSYPPSPNPYPGANLQQNNLINIGNSPTPPTRTFGSLREHGSNGNGNANRPNSMLFRQFSDPGHRQLQQQGQQQAQLSPTFANYDGYPPNSDSNSHSPSSFSHPPSPNIGQEIQKEIRRMSKDSIQVKRASLSGENSANLVSRSGSISGPGSGSGSPIKSPTIRTKRRSSLPLLSTTPTSPVSGSRQNIDGNNYEGGGGMMMVNDLSPVRGSFDTFQEEPDVFAISSPASRSRKQDRADDYDEQLRNQWEGQGGQSQSRQNRSPDGTGRKFGYAI
ncbi:uncharacterized protein I303_105252 [Kwoniella dejecticola CBS 10117]|uniref:P-type phospholipid transporter n=1 Tax=Kwoniella dejecticola CBS 10117 TaxID=1296121 RepID=A0A1A6A305_9TREE|nr:phospholipid-translocating ATPase [Kwoniella dejecticola CBS 10117]OBR84442.1 phospholipid-translocating ATPase [Kwoniella dejecticola CBS 10117]